MLAKLTLRETQGKNHVPLLLCMAGQTFYNTSLLDVIKLMGDQDRQPEHRAYRLQQAIA